MTKTFISPAEARKLIEGGAKLVDIRGPDEHAREHIPGALNLPLDQVEQLEASDCAIVFHCRSGARTEANAARLKAVAGAHCHILEGGLDAWRQAGFETRTDRRQPLELMRQVQLAAGALVLLGVLLGLLMDPGFLVLAAFVGAGLMLAGATGWCGMARLLRHMPWNRRMAA